MTNWRYVYILYYTIADLVSSPPMYGYLVFIWEANVQLTVFVLLIGVGLFSSVAFLYSPPQGGASLNHLSDVAGAGLLGSNKCVVHS